MYDVFRQNRKEMTHRVVTFIAEDTLWELNYFFSDLTQGQT